MLHAGPPRCLSHQAAAQVMLSSAARAASLRRICSAASLRVPSLAACGSVSPPHIPMWGNAISSEEEELLVREAERALRQRRYEPGHFDGVIKQYREVQRPLGRFSEEARAVLNRVMKMAFPAGISTLPVHILDLLPEGVIGSHVDSKDYSGSYVVGLSLLSHSVMTLKHQELSDAQCQLFLPRCSLYVLHGAARYEWAHAITQTDQFCGQTIPHKGRRISFLFRDRHPTELSRMAPQS
eukprot:3841588-Pleurochrysis_carterae.AAC.1